MPMDGPTVSMIIALVGSAISVAAFFVGRVSAGHDKGREAGELKQTIKNIKEIVERIEAQSEKNTARLEGRVDFIERVADAAADTAKEALLTAKSAHKRMDTFEGKKGN